MSAQKHRRIPQFYVTRGCTPAPSKAKAIIHVISHGSCRYTVVKHAWGLPTSQAFGRLCQTNLPESPPMAKLAWKVGRAPWLRGNLSPGRTWSNLVGEMSQSLQPGCRPQADTQIVKGVGGRRSLPAPADFPWRREPGSSPTHSVRCKLQLYTILYYITLYYTILYGIVLYCIIF